MNDDRLYLVHILECMGRIEAYTADGRDAFMADPKTQDAVIRNLEIIGEAAKRLSPQTRDRAAEVPWRRLGGLRDVLIHEYAGVDLGQVWRIVERDLPPLKRRVEALMQDSEERQTGPGRQRSDTPEHEAGT